jgi:hypothetical protein
MKKASSIHSLNADRGLSKIERIMWMFYNFINNRIPRHNIDENIAIGNFNVKDLDRNWHKIDAVSSPARRLSDFFWLQLPWQQIAKELGGEVRAIEIGCGSGRYGGLLRDYLGENLSLYTGVDIKSNEEWSSYDQDSRFKFIIGNSASFDDALQNANFIMTQSALEHFDEDLTFFRQIAEHVAATQKPVIQVHLMPSAGCQATFLWHGVRHYTPRSLSKITRLFGHQTKKALFGLGSKNCNRVHRQYITIPSLLGKGDMRKSKTKEYERQLKEAIVKDHQKPNANETSFYALILQSYVDIDLSTMTNHVEKG